jgi:hypothetical protein
MAMRPLPHAAAAALCAALLLLTGCSTLPGSSPKADPGNGTSAKPVLTKPNLADDLLFVARSETATLKLDKTGNGTLKMKSVPTMTWFSDRPDHDAGTTKTSDALAAFGWKKNGDDLGKGDMAPNAALTAHKLPDTVVLEILTVDRDGDDISFTVKDVADKLGPARKVALTDSDLFIDSVAPTRLSGAFLGGIGSLSVGGYAYVGLDAKTAANVTLKGPGYTDQRYTIGVSEADPVADIRGLGGFGLKTVELVPAVVPADGSATIRGYIKLTGAREYKVGSISPVPADIHVDPPFPNYYPSAHEGQVLGTAVGSGWTSMSDQLHMSAKVIQRNGRQTLEVTLANTGGGALTGRDPYTRTMYLPATDVDKTSWGPGSVTISGIEGELTVTWYPGGPNRSGSVTFTGRLRQSNYSWNLPIAYAPS